TPSLPRRLASLFYEALLLAAVLFLAGFLVVGLMPTEPSPLARLLHQAYLILAAGAYLIWFWRHGGQTLAMKTWRIRLERVDGERLTLGQAWLRYLLAAAGVMCFGLGLIWALFDPDRQFLHDRLARTRLVSVPPG
ncbi:MAG: RDD family protein, partial [Chromatiaceae bacterium]|nr:RDD family protein [Candidatus Thioaporhodococcus sediminis]